MGQNNRQRRAAKVRARKRQERGRPAPAGRSEAHGPGSTGRGWPGPGSVRGGPVDLGRLFQEEQPEPEPIPDDQQIDAMLEQWIMRSQSPDGSSPFDVRSAGILFSDEPALHTLVDRRLSRKLTAELRECWQRGWLPMDLHRAVFSASAPLLAGILHDAMAAEVSRHAPVTVDRTYRDQLRELGEGVWWSSDRTPLIARAFREAVDWVQLLANAVHLVAMLRLLRPLPVVCPPPGQAAPARAKPGPDVDDKILERVRQLLAKAESTTFDAEAETFTAGAQALMARHSIDVAMLARKARKSSGPASIRIYVDAPYDSAKTQLLTEIAQANRCRAIWFKNLKFMSVVGFHPDLVATEALFTSLLVQATASMHRAGTRQDAGGRSRTRSFRSSFLISFAQRIGERLSQVTADEVSRAAGEVRAAGSDLLPVLAARDEEVEATFHELFPNARHIRSRSGRDAEGWYAGRAAADQAALEYGAALSS